MIRLIFKLLALTICFWTNRTDSKIFYLTPVTTVWQGLEIAKGSQRALNMLFAIRTIQERTGKDLGATFLSGTTISNSLTELYLLFKYLRPKELERQNINSL